MTRPRNNVPRYLHSNCVQCQFKENCFSTEDVTNGQGDISVAKKQQLLVNDLEQHLNFMRAALHPELMQQHLRVSHVLPILCFGARLLFF